MLVIRIYVVKREWACDNGQNLIEFQSGGSGRWLYEYNTLGYCGHGVRNMMFNAVCRFRSTWEYYFAVVEEVRLVAMVAREESPPKEVMMAIRYR